MSEATRQTVVANVLNYVAAWNEPNAASRLQILGRCWAKDASYVDPNVKLRGRAALCEHITKLHARRPGARIEMMSGVDLHHNVVRFLWRLIRVDGSFGDLSIDFGEVGATGKLNKIVGFFGEAPRR